MESASTKLSTHKTFVTLVVLVTIAFAVVLWPFYAAIFWAAVLAIVFEPLNRRLRYAMGSRNSLAALSALLIIVFIVILPSVLVGGLVLQEASALMERMQSGEFNLAQLLRSAFDAMPAWMARLMEGAGLGNLSALQERLTSGFSKGAQVVAAQALSVGQNTFDFVVGFFVMLYVLFFFLRDGRWLSARINSAIPLDESLRRRLGSRFVEVVRATVKGNVVVAILQGTLGGIAFWVLGIRAAFLWAVLMAILSLLPAIGTAIVWLPVAIYFILSGQAMQGIALIAFGVLVIGLVDNVVRPILVGKDTRMPDYIVLVTTLGGMAIFGLNGFVIGPLVAAMFMAVWDSVASARSASAAQGDVGRA